MPSQIIFLFDLEQCLPLVSGLTSEEFEQQVSFLKHVCLKILCGSSSLGGFENGVASLPHFAFRFYSSTEYFMVSQDVEGATFYELSEETFSLLETALLDRFERLWQRSKTNSFDPRSLLNHIQSDVHKPHAHNLRKAIEEIAVLYNWDRPMLHSPMKKVKSGMDENALFIFTKLPDTAKELNQFLGTRLSQSRIQPNVIFDEIFNQPSPGSNVNYILNVFKGDASVRVLTVDTGTPNSNGSADFDQRIKHAFQKAFKQLRGNVIPLEAFRPESTESSIVETTAETIRTATLINTYVSDDQDKKPKQGSNKSGTIKIDFNGSLSTFNFEPLNEEPSSGPSNKSLHATILGSVPQGFFNASQNWESHFCIWPHRDQPSLSELFGNLKKNVRIMLCQFEGVQLGIIVPSYTQSALLSVLNKEDSQFYSLVMGITDSHYSVKEEFGEDFELIEHLANEILENKDLRKRPIKDINKVPLFQAHSFDSWRVPETRSFFDLISQVKREEKSFKKETLSQAKELQKAYLPTRATSLMDRKLGQSSTDTDDPFPKRISEEVTSGLNIRSNFCEVKKKMSRGAELLRLGSKNAEIKRNTSEDASKNVTLKSGGASTGDFEIEKESLKLKYQNEVDEALKTKDEQKICLKLMELQLNYLHQVGDCHAEGVALAEVTLNSMLIFLQTSSKGRKTSLEDMMEKNFMVDPSVINKRKTTMVEGGRIRDHKIQVLFRVELHYRLANQVKQAELEDQILIHLRQISVWDSPKAMVSFLNEVIAPTYILRQPDLLHMIFDELNLQPPSGVRELFSPSKKSDCSSVATFTFESPKSGNSTAVVDTHSRAAVGANNLLRRMSSFDSKKLLQINMAVVDRKRKIVKPPTNVGPSKARKLTKTPTKGPSSIRRNLKFDAFQSPRKTSKGQKTPKKNLSKSPLKTPSKKSLHKTPQKSSFVTPKKVTKATPVKLETPKRKHDFSTPCKMTPGKVHRILAPETPTEKPGHRRKSDGTLFITESPDIDMIKQTKATPRRASASVALHKKTSFYSGNTSRSTARAEELIEASRLQSSLLQAESQDLNISSRRTSDQNTSILSNLLFSHLLKKTPAKESEVNTNKVEIQDEKNQSIERVEQEAAPPSLTKKEEEEEDFMAKINRRLFDDAAKSLPSHSGTFRRTRRSSQLQDEADGSKGSPVKRSPLKPANLPSLDEVSLTFKSPAKKSCGEKISPRRPKPLILDNLDQPSSRLVQGGIGEMIESPTLYERPSRRKSSTVRFGIDDIPLNEALHSPFGKNYRKMKVFSPSTPKNAPNNDIISELEASNLSASEAESVQDSDNSFGSQIKNASRNKLSLSRLTRLSRNSNDSSNHDTTNSIESFLEPPSKSPERPVVKVTFPKCYTEMVDFPGLGKSDQSEKSVLDSPAHLETSSVESLQTPLQPHGKWSIVESVESPEGIKIKLNRRRCSKAAPPSTRISRKQANEVGIPLDKLLELITKTSPDKPFITEKENSASNNSKGATNSENDDNRHLLKKLDSNTLTPGSRASIAEKAKFSPLTSKSLFDLTTSPIVDSGRNPNKATHEKKPRKVNKRLYAEELAEPNKK